MQQSDYAIIPGQDDIEKIERDLRFHPTVNSNPQSLTIEQISAFNRDGYLKGIRIFSKEEIEGIRHYFDQLLQKVVASGGNSYSISTAHLKYGKVWEILGDRRIVAIVRDLLGENLIGWGSHFFCKMPHDGKGVAWHQDASYWPLSVSKALTVWLAIDDADRENGCMKFISGSHHHGHLTYRPSRPEEHNVLDQTVEDVERFGIPILDELSAGEISIHSDLLLHGSDPNASDRRRCGLTLRYCAAEVRAGLNWNEKGVILSGTDPTGHWNNAPRPEVD